MRLEITQRTELALFAIRVLHRHESPLKGADLAEELETTSSYLPHIVRPLVRQGWVESDPGPSGGYRLVVDPVTITLLDLIEAIEGPTDDGRCVLRGSPCTEADPCALHDSWQVARNALLDELRRTVLTEIDPPGDKR